MRKLQVKKLLFFVIMAMCALPVVGGPVALLSGFLFRNLVAPDELINAPKLSKAGLQAAVIGLGLCLNIEQAGTTGTHGLVLIMASVITVLGLGYLLARWMRLDRNLSFLISSGTAICGGSAIASVAPVMDAPIKDISVALSVVFLLNAVAIFVFPGLGYLLDMSQTQFGLWCAVAIHDTSSVVGAASVYGQQALELATTAKLARVLWIIPVVLILSVLNRKGKRVKLPWFVLLFVLALIINYHVSLPAWFSLTVFQISKSLMSIVLCLMGSTLVLKRLKQVGYKPLLFGALLWIVIGTTSAWLIVKFF